jgi:hypothetical protein
MNKFTWLSNRNQWKGPCPRCGVTAYFQVVASKRFSNPDVFLDLLECPEGHGFLIESENLIEREFVQGVYPISAKMDVPEWLPAEYREVYEEMYFSFKSKKYRSAIALAGILLEAHVNSLIKNPGEKKKSLFDRLSILINEGKINHEQFAEATVARLSRNETLHPESLAESISENTAEEIIRAVSSCLEQYYKFRASKALPAPTEI